MLDLSKLNLSGIAEALEDHSYETQWYFDRQTGEVVMASDYLDDEDHRQELEERDLVYIEPLPSRESYQDLVDFSTRVRDPKPRDLLLRAIEGRGAFRRFKDTLLEFPELRDAWFGFHDGRMRRRAIRWAVDEGLVDEGEAERALSEIEDPHLPQIPGAFDPHQIARDVAAELRELYGDCLKKVVLYGSWARGDAHIESDVDLLVVLDQVRSWRDERNRMDDVLWRHSVNNGTVISALIVSESDYLAQDEPVLAGVARDGIELV